MTQQAERGEKDRSNLPCPICNGTLECSHSWHERECASLRAQLEAARTRPSYHYIGRDGKTVTAKELEDRAEAAEAKLAGVYEECAKLIDDNQEIVTSRHGIEDQRTIEPRRHGNLMGLGYAAAIRQRAGK